jgi:hypothetical protein
MPLCQRILLISALLAIAFLIACGSSKPPISVSVTAPRSQTDQGLTIAITGQITNDRSYQGLKWSLTGVGSLSATIGGSVTYTAPAASNITTVQSATVTATSVADPTKSASLAISVNPLPSFTNLTGVLPPGNVGTSYSQSIAISGGTPPFSWAYGYGSIPPGTNFNASTGTISGTPTGGGTWWFAVQATDAAEAVVNNIFDIVVQQHISGNNPIPFLTQPLVPSSISPGGDEFTLTVNGTGFSSTATVNFDGAALETTFVNQGQLQAAVPAASVASPATHSITVVNPKPGGGSSNVIYFPVAAPEATPNFSPMGISIATVGTESVLVSDFNQDGKLDLAISWNTEAAILLGNGDGTFVTASGSPFNNPTPPWGGILVSNVIGVLAGGDFFNNGHPGLALVGQNNSDIAVFKGNGDGTLSLSPTPVFVNSPTDSELPTTVAVADLNGDGYLDLIAESGAITTPLLGYGNGAFTAVPPTLRPAGVPVVGDFNGDGKLDFALLVAGGVGIFLGNGDGTFTQASTISFENGLNAMATADFNGDGKLDLAVIGSWDQGKGNWTYGVHILLGNGDGTFTLANTYTLSGTIPSILVGDFLNHGKLDLLLGYSLLPGNGDGTFQSPISLPYGNGGYAAAIGDFNGSGRLGYATVGGASPNGIGVVIQQ